MDLDFNLASSITAKIEEFAESNGISLIDAIVHYAEVSGLEIEFLGEILKKNDHLKTRIELEAESLNFIRKKSRLPLDE